MTETGKDQPAVGAPDPTWPRYSAGPLPPYRYVPGRQPHPRRHPLGHAFGQPEPPWEVFPPEAWRAAETYLRGIDLYNFGYWWESHEAFEALWQAAGRGTLPGRFFQGLIHIAAANLKRATGELEPADRLRQGGVARLRQVPSRYMGMAVEPFILAVEAYFAGARPIPALIRLED
ncbi:MAG: DUF309 domain-containing protein [Nitrospirales bacterium]